MKNKFFLAFIAVSISFVATGCDPDHLEKCEWYLVPEPADMDKVEAGMVALCARNFNLKKQRCRLQASLDLAKSSFDKKVRFSELEIDKSGKFPRTITAVKQCE